MIPTPAATRRPNWVLARRADRQQMEQDQAVDRQQPERADQAELLGQHREDEIRVHLRHEVEMDLRPVQKALAENAAGAERDLGLGDVEAGAERVDDGSRKVSSRFF